MIKTLKFLILIILLSSCSQKRAPVVDRGSEVYDRAYFKQNYNSYSKRKPDDSDKQPNWIKVKKDDTIYGISRQYGVSIRDLINHNNLSSPYVLHVGQRIILPKSNYHIVRRRDTLYGISRQYGMNVNSLIAINDLQYPYQIRVGQKLKISKNVTSKTTEPVKNHRLQPVRELTVASKNNKFIKPVNGNIISSFGPKSGGLYNDGINIQASKGTSVGAAEDGVVAYVGDELRGYGNLIIVKHSDGWISAYAHLDKTFVERGGKVNKGQKIATVGSTGNVKTSQLYFGLRKGRKAVNPVSYL